jgi:uncharacterized protein YjbJ (UPF0337 family)
LYEVLGANRLPAVPADGGAEMATDDKFENKAEEVKGQVKEKTGQVKGDDKMRAEGKAEQSKANLKQAGENVKDAFKK